MNSTDILMATLNPSGKNQHIHIEDVADLDSDEYDTVRTEFAASLGDSIVILREKRDKGHTDKGRVVAWAEPGLGKPPKCLRLRVFFARLVRW